MVRKCSSILHAGLVAIAGAFASIGAEGAFGQSYPTKPIKLIVGFGSGTPPDVLGRVVAQKLSEGLGQQILVENRPGAGGTPATAAVANAAPDGYTLTIGSTGTIAIAPALFAKAGYDARSFAPISLIGTAPLFLVVHPSVPASTLKEFIELARSRPGQLNYGTGGSGSPPHIVMETFKSLAQVDLVHVAYKGSQFPALIAGEVQATMGSPSTFAAQARAGKLRLLTVASATRHPAFPEVPTALEAGLPGFEMSAWQGLVAPRGTPPAIIERLNAETRKALATSDLRDAFAKLGTDPVANSPDEFAAFIAAEAEKWARAVKLSGAKIE